MATLGGDFGWIINLLYHRYNIGCLFEYKRKFSKLYRQPVLCQLTDKGSLGGELAKIGLSLQIQMVNDHLSCRRLLKKLIDRARVVVGALAEDQIELLIPQQVKILPKAVAKISREEDLFALCLHKEGEGAVGVLVLSCGHTDDAVVIDDTLPIYALLQRIAANGNLKGTDPALNGIDAFLMGIVEEGIAIPIAAPPHQLGAKGRQTVEMIAVGVSNKHRLDGIVRNVIVIQQSRDGGACVKDIGVFPYLQKDRSAKAMLFGYAMAGARNGPFHKKPPEESFFSF